MQGPQVRFFIEDRQEHRDLRLARFLLHALANFWLGFDFACDHVFRATQIIETPNGRFMRCSHQLSAPKMPPSNPFSMPMFTLFSEAGLKPVRRISQRPNRIGPKNVMLA